MVDIYALKDPRTGAIRYIGKANDARKRFAGHLRDSRRRDTPVYRWIRKLLTAGLSPELSVLSVVNVSEWEQAEIEAIASAKAAGAKLLNVAEGGNEPFCSREVRSANGHASWKRLSESVPPVTMRLYRHLGHNLAYFRKRIREHNDGHGALKKTEMSIACLHRILDSARAQGALERLDEIIGERFPHLRRGAEAF